MVDTNPFANMADNPAVTPQQMSGMVQNLPSTSTAAQNALILKAIQSGAQNQAMQQNGMQSAQGSNPMANANALSQMPASAGAMAPMTPVPPTNPSTMSGGLGASAVPAMPMGASVGAQSASAIPFAGATGSGVPPTMQGTDPVTAALFSSIPGGGQ